MERFVEKMPAAALLCGGQQVDTSLSYRRASFCILTKVDGAFIVYNTLTGELLELSCEEAALFSGNALPYCRLSEYFVKSYFLVAEDFDEIAFCDGIKKTLAYAAERAKGGYRNFTVFPTTDCNARCFYCYEHGMKRVSMSEETAKRTADFIVESSCGEAVSLTWYGGEPLMNMAAIDTVSAALEAANVTFTAKLATNGSLLDKTVVQRAKTLWHVDKAQITVDGTEAVYNRIKAYADGRKNAFSDVLDNIDCMLDAGIMVNVRLNIEEHNIGDMHALADVLAKRFSARAGFNVYTAMLFDCEGAKRPATSESGREELAKEMIALEDRLSSLGVLHPRKLRRSLAYCYCKADSPSSLVITAEGKLVKCDFFTAEHFVGDVENGIDKNLLAEEKEIFTKRIDGYKYCRTCSAYPVCLRLLNCPTCKSPCDAVRRYLTEERLVRSAAYVYKKAKEGRA